MEFGVTMFATDYSMGPADLAVAVEERGLDALFIPDHSHIPASRESPFPSGGEMPPDYSHNLDMFVSLAAAAAVTKRIRLGTGICLVVERDPIATAKAVASLDHMSGGRVDFGVGGGWNREEMENHGGDWSRRWKLMRERVEAMKAIWTQDAASYEGELVNFEKIWSWPKPIQKPHPPVFVGGDGARTLNRVVRYGDGWIPSMAGVGDARIDHICERLAELNRMLADAGRDPVAITGFTPPRDPNAIDRLREAGVTRCVFGVKAAPAEDVLPRLDRLAQLAEQLR